MDLDAITVLAYDAFGTQRANVLREPGYTFYHGQRVGRLAVSLRQAIMPEEASKDALLYLGGLFHDSTKGDEPHNETGAALVRKLLGDYCAPDELDTIAEIVRLHNKRGTSADPLVQLVQDADILDHEGAQAVWLLVAASITLGQSVSHAVTYWHAHLPPKKRKRALNFPLSRELYQKRRRFANALVERLAREAEGELI